MKKVFEEIINNNIENMYNYILVLVKDKNIAMDVIIKSLDKLFTIDFKTINILNITDKFKENLKSNLLLFTDIKQNHKDLIFNEMPYKLYNLNFNIFKYFNDIDNLICISICLHNANVKELSNYLNLEENFIIERFSMIMNFIKVSYIETIRKKIIENDSLILFR